jgi:acetyl esterase/lipase
MFAAGGPTGTVERRGASTNRPVWQERVQVHPARNRRLITGVAMICVTGAVASGCALSTTHHGAAPTFAPPTAERTFPPTAPATMHGQFGVAPAQRLYYPVQIGIADPAQNFGDLYLPVSPVEDPAATVAAAAGPHGAPTTVPLPPKLPVVVLLHGGGWRSNSGLDATASMAAMLASHGIAVWNVEYRRIGAGGGYPITLTDTAAAIDYLQTIRTEVAPNLDLNNVIVAGHSAGGQLAVWAAGRTQLTPGAMGSVPAVIPRAVVSMSGVLDMKRAISDGNASTRVFLGIPQEFPQKFSVADPMENINPKIPVTCFNGTADQVVKAHECTDFIAALRKDGGTGDAILMPGAKHNVYMPTQAQGRYWPAVQKVILGYVDQFRTATGR